MPGVEIIMKTRLYRFTTLLAMGVFLCVCRQVCASQQGDISNISPEEMFENDWDMQIEEVNEGALEILVVPPEKPVHFHFNQLYITRESLRDGWLALSQCHENLDPVPELQIVYNRERIRDLMITSSKNIKKSWVEGHSVQLEDVQHESKVCIKAETRALQKEGDKIYVRNGPFMRRFLDGYYPMHVRVEVSYSEKLLELINTRPVVKHNDSDENNAVIDLWFNGKLKTEFEFVER